MSDIKTDLHALAGDFVEAMLVRLRQATLTELLGDDAPRPREPAVGASRIHLAAKAKKSGRLARRSQDQILASAGKVAELLRKSGGGLRAEQIQKSLDLDKRETPRVLREGVKAGILSKKGQKRATVYTVKAKASKRSSS
jgi:hypothetical protein